ncbi:MAG: Superfamily II DNA/RNA helicase [Candidatus Ozemobacter sibiricus]|jgi:superfamily II DNA or RNA helicase|uniref:Superfamily II DNA/RNA helicase n=1 Tax=Candidatus Ozemobacter sibiricus TaxID=2268124 RepID=A0A367ZCG3_9BACT|nr:MAG: Superfamily II DNA/RNA helicase [Candidatus Ozemobacter sibiricus]
MPRSSAARPKRRRSVSEEPAIYRACSNNDFREIVWAIERSVTPEAFQAIVPWLKKVVKEPRSSELSSDDFHETVVRRIINPLREAGYERAALNVYRFGAMVDILYYEDAEEMLRLAAHLGDEEVLEGLAACFATSLEAWCEMPGQPASSRDDEGDREPVRRTVRALLDRWQRHREKCLKECRRTAERLAEAKRREEERKRAAEWQDKLHQFHEMLQRQYGKIPEWAPTTAEDFQKFCTAPRSADDQPVKRQGAGRGDQPAPGSTPTGKAGTVSPAAPLLKVPDDRRLVPLAIQARLPLERLTDRWGEEGLRACRVAWAAQRIHLMREFDELLCTESLVGVIPHRHQIETARRVLTRFRGRAILADEVGLGKTIEAGLVIKEYLLRGLARRVLILVPPALVSQWQGEMQEKFGLEFVTTASPLAREDPVAFWSRPLVLASIGLARLEPHTERCLAQPWDLVVVDEAHHLRNATSRSHRLVKALPRKFLLLLTATPVQNQLMELYHLINLLQPGTLGTAADFRARFIQPRKPTEPLDRDQLRALLRTVMIRNTRRFTDVRLPRRFASTIKVEPLPREFDVLHHLSRALSPLYMSGDHRRRLACAALLGQVGSSPLAARPALEKFAEQDLPPGPAAEAFAACLAAARQLRHSAKDDQLLALLRQKPGEKVLIFTRFRATLAHVAAVLEQAKIGHAVFHGEMSGPERDRAVESFRDEVPVLVATESGGEGRNLQFCRTIVNYDLPWNPMRIEQRIGRLHRIGQTRDVFIFNFCLRGSLEERMLAILEEKINLFELVVGEMGMVLGHLGEEADFEDLLLEAWLASPDEDERSRRFEELAAAVTQARQAHDKVKAFDEALFQEEYEA